jgi:hypothetical protein
VVGEGPKGGLYSFAWAADAMVLTHHAGHTNNELRHEAVARLHPSHPTGHAPCFIDAGTLPPPPSAPARGRHLTRTPTAPHCLSQIPTGTGNTVRSFYYARTTVRSQGSSTTVSRSDNSLLGSQFGPVTAVLTGAVSLSSRPSWPSPHHNQLPLARTLSLSPTPADDHAAEGGGRHRVHAEHVGVLRLPLDSSPSPPARRGVSSSLRLHQVCVYLTQVCVYLTQVCVNPTQVCVSLTQVCVNLTQVCVTLLRCVRPKRRWVRRRTRRARTSPGAACACVVTYTRIDCFEHKAL